MTKGARLTIAMYHYVRDLPQTRYPNIKGLLVSEFRRQIAEFKHSYEFVTLDDCIEAIDSGSFDILPPNPILLTFDDGYSDHFVNAYPILRENAIKGCFFPSAKAVLENKVLDVNKIHFLLAVVNDVGVLLKEVYGCLDRYRPTFHLKPNSYYFEKLAKADQFDAKETIFIKRLLQVELDDKLRKLILEELFTKYVTSDEASFSKELYMDVEQLKELANHGMHIGGHGYEHYWLDRLSPQEQENDINLSLKFLQLIRTDTNKWAMCYPYGSYNNSLIQIIADRGCRIGFTTNSGIARLNKNNAYTLERLDATIFQKP